MNGPNRLFDPRCPLRPPGPRWYKGHPYSRFDHLLSGIPPHYLEGRRFDAIAACGAPIHGDAMETENPNACPMCVDIQRTKP